tara:strand:- start:70 stop:585 length:516 start_codon:yes stop_codon:yes gene_type:complete
MTKNFQYKYTFKKLLKKDVTASYISWLNNPIVNKFLAVKNKKQNKETVSNYIDSFYGEEEKYIWGIYHDKEMIGTTTLAFPNKVNNSIEAGLMIGETAYWGRLASDSALKFSLNFAFNELKKDSVTGACCDENIGMVFTFKKFGFEREGILHAPQTEVVHQWRLTKDKWSG